MSARLIKLLLVPAVMALAPGGLPAHPNHRLPAGYQWGRCLLVVGGETRISGKCAYQIFKGGGFHIDGPRQIYDGIDYPVAKYGYQQQSRDYWADVSKEDDGSWSGYGNSDIRAVHGDPPWENLHREGACYVNSDVRVCLWQK